MRVEQLRGSRHGLTAEERRARRLNDLLVSKDSVPELLLALRRHAPELGAVHRGTAVHRLAKAEDGATWLHSPGVVQLIEEVAAEVYT